MSFAFRKAGLLFSCICVLPYAGKHLLTRVLAKTFCYFRWRQNTLFGDLSVLCTCSPNRDRQERDEVNFLIKYSKTGECKAVEVQCWRLSYRSIE